jgi:hypothetical protein
MVAMSNLRTSSTFCQLAHNSHMAKFARRVMELVRRTGTLYPVIFIRARIVSNRANIARLSDVVMQFARLFKL